MKVEIRHSEIGGEIHIPASKSAMQRACAAALLREGKTELRNPGVSEDDKAALSIIQQLGAEINLKEGGIEIKSDGLKSISNTLNCGESGLSARMFTMIASCLSEEITIEGHGSLLKRPLHFEILEELGVKLESNQGFLPIKIQGPLIPKNIEVDGSVSSQYLTGLLFAYAASNADDVSIRVSNLSSKPYIDLTLQIMDHFGLALPENKNYEEFIFKKQLNKTGLLSYEVEGDWSSASFPLAAAAIKGEITIKGLKYDSVQSDRKIVDVLIRAGAQVELKEREIKVRASKLKGFDFDATDCPDLFPPIAALACFSKGESRIKGAHRLIHKESNRAETLESEFKKMNADISFTNNEMIIRNAELRGATVSSNGDHRIAMALAIAAMGAKGSTIIDGASDVKKSYPQFWSQMKEAGMKAHILPNA